MNHQFIPLVRKLALWLVLASTWIQLATAPGRAQTGLLAGKTALTSQVDAGQPASTLPDSAGEQGAMVALRGNTPPEAVAKNDRGRVSDDLTINHLMLQLQRTPEQEQALQQFIKDIHDPASPLFHHWIAAAEFGQRYGVAPAEVAKVRDWLDSQGFKVNLVYPNQMVIDFTASAGQIRQAFHTEIHHLMVNGQSHIANMSDPQIPAGLAPMVKGVVSLNDFRSHPTYHPRTNYTLGSGYYLVVPADLATIYNLNPAFAAGYSGQGQTIVVVEPTDLYTKADWDTFRSVLGLASAYPLGSLTTVHPPSSPTNNCTDPGVNGWDGEAAVDAEWASAGAPSATIELASCADTDTNFGSLIALQNLLNAGGSPPAIVSISASSAETQMGASFQAYVSSLYQQGVTEGVSIFVAAGDWGADTADASGNYAVNGITVNGLATTPYNVAVGGTDFADYYEDTLTTYWNTSNAANYGSALSYVPEIPWNDSCASVLVGDYLGILPTYGSAGLCNQGEYIDNVAGSGGPSSCATGAPDIGSVVGGTCAGYLKPWWQSGLIGNPNDGVRDTPDVSLFAANGIWGHYYVDCFSDPSNGGASCSGTPDTWVGGGGTSFSAPIMAGIQALVNQASGSRWGNPNPAYYALAASEYGSGGSGSCNSALGNSAATNCIFYDVTQIPLLYTGSGTGGDNDVVCSGVNCYAPSGAYGVLSTAPQALSSAWVTGLGSGYTGAPSCILSGGGGSGAACSASITGVVTSITLTDGGSGYTSSPTCILTGGGGSGASCAVNVCTNDEVCSVYLTNFGSGYTTAPTCTLSEGGGTGATCTVTEALGIAVSLTAPGSGYTTMPSCALSGGGGTGGTCAALASNTSDDYQPAFGAATGWDFATGIGTVNASNLVASFSSSSASLSTLSLTFLPQLLDSSSAAQSVTVTNNGTGNLTILAATIGGADASDFAISADTCTGATVIPNGTCTVSVAFTPRATGSLSASLNFADVAPHSPQTVSLSGTGTAPLVITASSGSMTYGGTVPTITPSYSGFVNGDTAASLTTQPTCSTTATSHSPVGSYPSTCSGAVDPNYTISYVAGSVTVTGPWLTLSLTSLTFPSQAVGTKSTAQAVTLTSTGDSTLNIARIVAQGDFIQTHTCGSSLGPGASCTLSVTFAPSAAGTRTGGVSLLDNAANSPQWLSLTGTGTGPGLNLSVTSLTFPSQAVGTKSTAQAVTLTSTGSSTLNITRIVAQGDFIQTHTCGSSLGPGASCTLSVIFAPSTVGTRTGGVSLIDNAGNSPQWLSLTGTGTGPGLNLSVTSLTFPSQAVGTRSTAQAVTLTSTGSSTLNITRIVAQGDFIQTHTCGSSLGPGARCTLSVTFAPSAGGTRTGGVSIIDNAANSPQWLSLTGTGTGPGLNLSVTSLTFPSQAVGTKSTAQAVTLTSTGNSTLNITRIVAQGDFIQTNTCGSSLAPGAHCTLSVTFEPSAVGTRTGGVSLIDNAANSPQWLSLTGTGTAAQASLSATTLAFGN